VCVDMRRLYNDMCMDIAPSSIAACVPPSHAGVRAEVWVVVGVWVQTGAKALAKAGTRTWAGVWGRGRAVAEVGTGSGAKAGTGAGGLARARARAGEDDA